MLHNGTIYDIEILFSPFQVVFASFLKCLTLLNWVGWKTLRKYESMGCNRKVAGWFCPQSWAY